jgi:hypothetical protein
LNISSDLQDRLDARNQALGRLDGITLLLPDPDQFLYTFIRKEAVLSTLRSRASPRDNLVSGDRHLTAISCPIAPVLTPREFRDRLTEPPSIPDRGG